MSELTLKDIEKIMKRRNFISLLAGLAAVPAAVKGLFDKKPTDDIKLHPCQIKVLEYWKRTLHKAEVNRFLWSGKYWGGSLNRPGGI